jgi:signal transduction histidine kinase
VTDLPSAERDSLVGLQRTVDALNQLVQISLILNSTLELDTLLQVIMDAATDLTDSEGVSILLMDKNTRELRFAAATGLDPNRLAAMAEIPVPLDGSVAGTILTQDRAIIIDDVSRDSRHYRQVDQQTQFHTRSILGVPMRIREQAVGVLEAVNKRQGRFTDDDVRWLTILASQAAIAIENTQLIADLQAAYQELTTLDKLKSDFIAVASHELRTPLTQVLGYAEFLREEARGRAGEHVEAVLSSAKHLRSLIEDMTNLGFVQMDDTEFKMETVTLNQVVQETTDDAMALADANSQLLIVGLPTEPIHVRADRDKLSMALTNILNNAIKFTPEGGVISVEAEVRPREAWVRIRDNGIGLPHDQLERVFDQFYQVEDHMTRRRGGLGLGLAIAKSVVEKHGGRIWADSSGPGQGSAFTFTLPLV